MSSPTPPLPPELKEAWATQSETPATPPELDRARLAAGTRGPRRESVRSHLTNAAILGATLAVLLWYFFGYLGLARWGGDGLAVLGAGLMLVPLAVRIGIEAVSLWLLLRVDFAGATTAFARASHRFLAFRTRVNARFVQGSLVAYTVGYYLLLYVFREAFSTGVLALLALSYPVIMGAVYFLAIRPGLREERAALARYEELVAGL